MRRPEMCWRYDDLRCQRIGNLARRSVGEYIEVFYNCLRSHTAIGGTSPVAFEDAQRIAEGAA